MDTSLGVLGICTAYESGFGKGLQHGPDAANPYSIGSNEHAAYFYGFHRARKRRAEIAGDAARLDLLDDGASIVPRLDSDGRVIEVSVIRNGSRYTAPTLREAIDAMKQAAPAAAGGGGGAAGVVGE